MPSEIVRIDNCRREDALNAVRSASGGEYCFVLCSAHGETQRRDLPWAETRFIMADGETITERDLNSGAPRCALLLDCCSSATAESASMAISEQRDERLQANRAAYEEALFAAEKGLVKILVTGPPATGDQKTTPLRCLLAAANSWSSGSNGVMYFPEAIDGASRAMKTADLLQRIEYLPGRRLRHFPFAVNL